ncbi:MAG: hypothetical protein A2253_04430 [Deltaproteobacteria bacterium RIFOXYA2_FULL_55_11]|nr:MAG: hypothetical protein A2X89_00685 [Deltaproteobacteria bacterium GWD2_55_8]OGQ94041.1 MAG: hypothetical protein A2253_04430 [Deltaproteobacteria bacterium RIFOXYA2_FULL_55_11]
MSQDFFKFLANFAPLTLILADLTLHLMGLTLFLLEFLLRELFFSFYPLMPFEQLIDSCL